jgi:16S rRNA (uracil1498-N3)-methyltransferase
MRRFFLAAQPDPDQTLVVTGAEAHHMGRVLRLRPGQRVEFFDGQGHVHQAVILSVSREAITTRVEQTTTDDAPALPLVLGQCLLKGKKMDFVVQKATELGVHELLPLVSEYCENHGDRDRLEERWRRIMIEACKQCRRAEPMRIHPVTLLREADFSSCGHRLVAWEGERAAALATDFINQPAAVALVMGPEGGLHDNDLHWLDHWGFQRFSLGPRILRGETATLAAVAILQYQIGALRPAPGSETDDTLSG